MAADGGLTALGISAGVLTLTAAGITIFGVSTGLHPEIMIAGFAGGIWAQSYHPPMSIWRRIALTIMASVIAGYLSPAVAAGFGSIVTMPSSFPTSTLQLPIAVLVGLVAHRVLGPAIMRWTGVKLGEDPQQAEAQATITPGDHQAQESGK